VNGFDDIERPQPERIAACVHCGFCLPTCPTYALWGEEMDSPRGRIYLMKAAVEGRAELTSTFVQHFDACLGCMACVTACPSGVEYGPLVERTRAQIERNHTRSVGERLFRAMLFRVLPYPAMVRAALAPVAILPDSATRLLRSVARFVAARVGGTLGRAAAAVSLIPALGAKVLTDRLPDLTPARGEQRRRVGLLAGCVQRVMLPEVNRATLRVLAAEGCEMVVPDVQGCCGALSRHAGRLDEARAFARQTIEVFERFEVDSVVVNAAGCGSCMKEYQELFTDDAAWHSRAAAFSTRVRDVTELLCELGEPRATRQPLPLTAAYHDACHLAHAQGIRAAPRQLLAGIPGLTVVELPEWEMCCGSAGIYNLVQPEAASALGERKARHIASLQPDVIATANPGCTFQLVAAGERIGFSRPVLHPIQLLDMSIGGAQRSG
jgi:glycolate oxidase iron-sulfur subunit